MVLIFYGERIREGTIFVFILSNKPMQGSLFFSQISAKRYAAKKFVNTVYKMWFEFFSNTLAHFATRFPSASF